MTGRCDNVPDVDGFVFGDISVLGGCATGDGEHGRLFSPGSEQRTQVARTVHRVPMAGFRFFNIYGQRQDPFAPNCGVISIFASKMEPRDFATISGDGG